MLLYQQYLRVLSQYVNLRWTYAWPSDWDYGDWFRLWGVVPQLRAWDVRNVEWVRRERASMRMIRVGEAGAGEGEGEGEEAGEQEGAKEGEGAGEGSAARDGAGESKNE